MERRLGRHARRPRVLIVVDTSVWADHFCNIPTPEVGWLRNKALYHGPLIVGDIVLLEILQGATSEVQASYIDRYLQAIGITVMLDSAGAVRAARNYRSLRQLGITIRKTPDMIIGSFCLHRGGRLLHRDRDFDAMERHLGLQVVHP